MLPSLRTYAVSATDRQPLVDFMISALVDAGCKILSKSDATRAPFVITFQSPTGERMGVVAYAFLATRTPTLNRPVDERSFQIKYGSKRSSDLHGLWIDPHGMYTTILVGIDTKENFFVAVDPALHNPTRFFIRLEFKDEHAEQILEKSWHAWERTRRPRSGLEEPIEVLVGGTRSSFMRYLRFERAASNLNPGDRQLLAEKPELQEASASSPSAPLDIETPELHRLAKEFSLGEHEILEEIANAKRLKMAVRGWVAERHLWNALLKLDDVSDCVRIDEDGRPDLQLRYRGGRVLTIECKNVLRLPDAKNLPRIDFQRTRASKSDPCSRYYSPFDFDILAGCLHAITESWEFRFALTADLAPHKKCEGRLNSNLRIGEGWESDARLAFEKANARGRA
jgi:hypothetical protein